MKRLAVFFTLAVLIPATIVRADQLPSESPGFSASKHTDAPPPTGRGKVLAGTLVTSIGGGIGLGLYVIGRVFYTCMGAWGETLKRCEKNAKEVRTEGTVLGLASVATGVPLIVWGGVNRRDYQQWKSHNDAVVFPPLAIAFEIIHRDF